MAQLQILFLYKIYCGVVTNPNFLPRYNTMVERTANVSLRLR
jgi:hypothetical protein